jgi:predicted Holliday junction resolvase-like endonuclease
MARALTAFFDEVAKLAGICPSCGHVFRLSDARPFKLVPRQPTVLDQIDAQQARIDAALDKLQQAELALRAAARKAGLAGAKHQLRQIDAVFSRAKLDPHDVKVLFDPVEYIVFDGMSHGKLRRVLLLAADPTTSNRRVAQDTIANAVASGGVSFKTLRILKDGGCSLT